MNKALNCDVNLQVKTTINFFVLGYQDDVSSRHGDERKIHSRHDDGEAPAIRSSRVFNLSVEDTDQHSEMTTATLFTPSRHQTRNRTR